MLAGLVVLPQPDQHAHQVRSRDRLVEGVPLSLGKTHRFSGERQPVAEGLRCILIAVKSRPRHGEIGVAQIVQSHKTCLWVVQRRGERQRLLAQLYRTHGVTHRSVNQ